MKKFSLARHLMVLLVAVLFLPNARAAFVVNVGTSPSRVPLGGTITYSITVSNTVNLVQSVQVLSQFSPDAVIIAAANNFSPGQFTTNAGQVTFSVDLLQNAANATFSLQLQPASGGSFTNFITVRTLAGTEAPVTTNVVVNLSAPEADLGLTVSGAPPTVVMGDQFSYTVALTNIGPTIANGVNLQSTLPPGISFVSVTPTIPSSFQSQQLLLTPDTLTNGTGASFVITLAAVTNGDFTISTTAVTTKNSDPVTNNNSAAFTLKALDFTTANVAIVNVSAMVFNRLTALMEQVVTVSNLTENAIDSVRVLATNLVAPNHLFNATGTNSGFPYVMVATSLAAHGTASANLQFYIATRKAIDVGLLAVEGPSLVSLPLPTGTSIPITGIAQLRTGGYSSVLLTFNTVVGRKYSLIAGDSIASPVFTNLVTTTNVFTGTNGTLVTNLTTIANLRFGTNGFVTNRVALYPPFVANSTHGQFIDSGPQVSGDGDRFYSVIEQP